jgi:hypothetical protein
LFIDVRGPLLVLVLQVLATAKSRRYEDDEEGVGGAGEFCLHNHPDLLRHAVFMSALAAPSVLVSHACSSTSAAPLELIA